MSILSPQVTFNRPQVDFMASEWPLGTLGGQSGASRCPLGPVNAHLGPLDSYVESLDTHFGPLNIHLGPLDNHSGPLDIHSKALNIQLGPLDIHLWPLDIHLWPLDINLWRTICGLWMIALGLRISLSMPLGAFKCQCKASGVLLCDCKWSCIASRWSFEASSYLFWSSY